jgi:hypothetical protein
MMGSRIKSQGLTPHRGITIFKLQLGVQLHVLATSSWNKSSEYPSHRRLCEYHGKPGHYRKGKNV